MLTLSVHDAARDGALDADKGHKGDAGEEEEPQDEPEHWNMKTIMPTRSPTLGGTAPLPPLALIKPASSVAVEDWSDMMDDGDDDLGLTSKVAQVSPRPVDPLATRASAEPSRVLFRAPKLSISNRKGVYHPSDMKSLGFSSSSPPVRSSSNPLSSSSTGPRSPRLELHSRQPSQPSLQTTPSTPTTPLQFSSLRLARTRSDSPSALGLGLAVDSPTGGDRDRRAISGIDPGRLSAGSETGSGGRSMESDLRKYSEGAEDYEDVFGKQHGQ